MNTSKIWFRQVVPAGYERATLLMRGTSPLLMNSGEVDVDGDEYRAYELLGQKKGKSLDDRARLRELEWAIGLHFDADLGPFIPAKNVKELLRESATKWRKGEEIVRSLAVVDFRIPLLYEGPRTQDELWQEGFRYTTMVANGGAGRGRVMRCRPQFVGWTLTVELAFDPEDLDFHFLEMVVERSRKYGFGDGRRIGFGHYDAALAKGDLHKAGSNGTALKQIDKQQLATHIAFVDQIVMGDADPVKAGV